MGETEKIVENMLGGSCKYKKGKRTELDVKVPKCDVCDGVVKRVTKCTGKTY
jgi:hypothetical protein